MTRHFGFTLAEVLITLGIIGVVAAMTMPTLINNTNGAQHKAAYKKALSVLNQAVTLNVALDDTPLNEMEAGGMLTMLQTRLNQARVVEAGETLKDKDGENGYTVIGDNKWGDKSTGNVTFFTTDGMMFQYNPAAAKCKKANRDDQGSVCEGFVDINGLKGPNTAVTCSKGSGDSCVVNTPTDVYPIRFYDQTFEPNSDAARAVLYGK